MNDYPKQVRLVEVGPRDGLQNEKQAISVADKIALCDALTDAGLPYVEVGSFVSPKWVPQMAGTAEVLAGIRRKPGVTYGVLVPNLQGLEAAMAAGVAEIAVFAAASETFSEHNINCSIGQSLERFAPVIEAARHQGMRVRGYVSCALGCPYEGDVSPDQVASVAEALSDLGCYEISLGDTIGRGTPGKVRALWNRLARRLPRAGLAGHFHDTYGQALANVYASLQEGIAVFDSSVAGLGGCPYAKGASGNVATEDVLYLLHGLDIETGVDLARVAKVGNAMSLMLGRETSSRVGKAMATSVAGRE